MPGMLPCLPKNKTKIVCTIGPSSRSPQILARLMKAGLDIARLNLSHGELAQHAEDIHTIRAVGAELGKTVTIMADLPGPKIRIGDLTKEPITLENDQRFTLTVREMLGNEQMVSVSLPNLVETVRPGDEIYLNDGFIQLLVEEVHVQDVVCRVTVGGTLRSRKGMNIPNVDLGVHAFTAHDRKLAAFALAEGVDALSQSFVDSADDITELRQYAGELGYHPFIIAKIERAGAVDNLGEILAAADGIMVARGDLGVEIPIARVPVVQKKIVRMANEAGKPVITATHMLESMIFNRLPTRAEATDVANAILDGTDCVMLSGESAVGAHPLAAVETLAAIATEAERLHRPFQDLGILLPANKEPDDLLEVIAAGVAKVIQQITPAAVVVPTRSGETARNITRYRLPVFIFGVSSQLQTCRELVFSYGVIPIHEPEHPTRWRPWIHELFAHFKLSGRRAVLTEGPSTKYPDRNDRLEIIDLQRN